MDKQSEFLSFPVCWFFKQLEEHFFLTQDIKEVLVVFRLEKKNIWETKIWQDPLQTQQNNFNAQKQELSWQAKLLALAHYAGIILSVIARQSIEHNDSILARKGELLSDEIHLETAKHIFQRFQGV